ncbi:site-specific integrase [Flavobacterium oreochromis]|nr:site-specific integrase [Flavobacterium oreochromis]QYS87220.1 site-specific integrase [Flavobacterium oreochromis]QYS87250.1 site-specific integrase [Flavobacterium oreochromis]
MRGQFDLYTKRNKVILGLVIYQALDAGSIGNLKVSDIDLQKAIIKVPSKTQDLFYPRNLPLEAVQIVALQEYIENIRPAIVTLLQLQSDYLFPYALQERFKMVLLSIKRKIKTYYKLEDFKIIRQSRIAHWLKIYDIRTVQYKTGHRKLQSFDKYKKTQIESLQDAIEKYHVF